MAMKSAQDIPIIWQLLESTSLIIPKESQKL